VTMLSRSWAEERPGSAERFFPAARFVPGMKASLLLAAGLVVLLAGTASADPILDIIYHNVTNVEGCVSASVQGAISIGVESGVPPQITLGLPTLTPPSPSCLELPAP